MRILPRPEPGDQAQRLRLRCESRQRKSPRDDQNDRRSQYQIPRPVERSHIYRSGHLRNLPPGLSDARNLRAKAAGDESPTLDHLPRTQRSNELRIADTNRRLLSTSSSTLFTARPSSAGISSLAYVIQWQTWQILHPSLIPFKSVSSTSLTASSWRL